MKSIASPVYVLGSSRIPFVKSMTTYTNLKRQDLMVAALNGLVERFGLEGQRLGDVALGAVLNGSGDFNLARESVLSTRLDPHTPGVNIQRACATGLEGAWNVALKAHTGSIDIGIGGGVDTNSDLPIEVSEGLQRYLLQAKGLKTTSEKIKLASSLKLSDLVPKAATVDEPRTHLSMGQHTELMVKEWKVTREEQDELALASHLNAVKAYEKGFFDDMVVPFMGLHRDGLLRPDTTMAKLAKLKPAFDKTENGTLTAGNSTAFTDGAASVLIANERGVKQLGREPLAQFVDFEVASVDFPNGEGLLMAPTIAVARLLKRNGLSFDDFDFFEIHEAFAGQVLCNIKAWESPGYSRKHLERDSAVGSIDRSKLNVTGSSLGLGHPFAATGARIAGTLAKLIHTGGGKKRGLISICTAGGMGVAAIMENV